MMRTSATGRADRAQAARRRAASGGAKRKAGFTLVELMVTIAVIGLAAGAVVLSMPDPRPAVGVEAEQFAARLARAREEAIMTNRPVAVEADASGYRFAQFDGTAWTPNTISLPLDGIRSRICPFYCSARATTGKQLNEICKRSDICSLTLRRVA